MLPYALDFSATKRTVVLELPPNDGAESAENEDPLPRVPHRRREPLQLLPLPHQCPVRFSCRREENSKKGPALAVCRVWNSNLQRGTRARKTGNVCVLFRDATVLIWHCTVLT